MRLQRTPVRRAACYEWVVFAGCLAGAARPGIADIVYRDIPDIHMLPSGTSGDATTFLDVDGDGANDLRFHLVWNYNPEGTDYSEAFDARSLRNIVSLSTSSNMGPEALSAGFPVQPTLPDPPPNSFRQWGTGGTLGFTSPAGSNRGWWSGAGYLGFRFAAADGNHYGWVSMSATAYRIDIFSYAYESTPDATIPAGAIPAPATAALGVLAAAGSRWRRR